jgi:RNA polymerase sigma-70 factor (ECF subfamily)
MKEQISETLQDLESFEDQALPLASALLGAALSMTSNRAEAEDLVQETFLRAFRSWDSFEKGTNLKAWLFRILTNLYITSYRKRRREPTMVVPEDASEFDLYQALGRPEDNSAEAVVMDSLVDEDVKAALAELPEDFRLTVLLADVEGFSYKEIAEIMYVPIGTVMSRLHRGRKALQKSLFQLARQRGFVSRDGAR